LSAANIGDLPVQVSGAFPLWVGNSSWEEAVLDASTHPPRVEKLHFEFSGWLGDAILETFPCVIATLSAAAALEQSGLTGIQLAELEVSTSVEFRDMYPAREIPSLRWLKVQGEAGMILVLPQTYVLSSLRRPWMCSDRLESDTL